MTASLICKKSELNMYFTEGKTYEIYDVIHCMGKNYQEKKMFLIKTNLDKFIEVPLKGNCFTFDFVGGEVENYPLSEENVRLISKALLNLRGKEKDLMISEAEVLQVLKIFNKGEL